MCFKLLCLALMMLFIIPKALSAVSPDRTRVIITSSQRSSVLMITNGNETQPYLSQSWIEDADGKKLVNGPLFVLPPLQRIEAGGKGTLRIISTELASKLPHDKETLFFLNIREIPPVSSNVNSLTMAIQTRLKVFYRPEAIISMYEQKAFKKISLIKNGRFITLENGTPYYLTFVELEPTEKNGMGAKTVPVMSQPYSKVSLGEFKLPEKGNVVVSFINDFGGKQRVIFSCIKGSCHAI